MNILEISVTWGCSEASTVNTLTKYAALLDTAQDAEEDEMEMWNRVLKKLRMTYTLNLTGTTLIIT